MANFDNVRPGDLIKADLINGLFAYVQDLEERISKLERGAVATGSPVIVTSVSPSGVLAVGTRVTFTGQGFSVPPRLNTVTIGTVTLTTNDYKLTSNDTQLVFDLPDIPGLVPGTNSLSTTVTNVKGSTWPLTLQVKQLVVVPAGNTFINYSAAPVMLVSHPNIESGSTYKFTFSLSALVDQDATYKLLLSSVESAGSKWTAQLLQDGSDLPRPTTDLVLTKSSPGNRKDITVALAVPNGLAVGVKTTLTFQVMEATPGTNVTPSQVSIDVVVGSPPPTPENRVRVGLGALGSGVTSSNGRVRIPKSAAAGGDITYNLIFTQTGTYDVSFAMRGITSTGDASTWLYLGQDRTKVIIGVADAPITTLSAPVAQPVIVTWKAGPTAPDTDMLVTIKRASAIAGQAISVDYAQPVGAS